MKRYINADESIILSEWDAPARPYSQKELHYMIDSLRKKLRLSNTMVFQEDCGHSYYVKFNGVKYKQVLETNSPNVKGNCSVCWKFNNTPRELKNACKEMINAYMGTSSERMSFDNFKITQIFYIWLFYEVFNKGN